MADTMSSWEETQLYEAKIRYEGERRKTELALAQVTAKTERRKQRLATLTDDDFLATIGIGGVLCMIAVCLTYGLTRPDQPADPVKYEYKKVLVQACADVKGYWDEDYQECKRKD